MSNYSNGEKMNNIKIEQRVETASPGYMVIWYSNLFYIFGSVKYGAQDQRCSIPEIIKTIKN